MATEGAVEKIDNAIASFFATGNGFTLVLAGILVFILIWPILTGQDPDIHPYLLARQSQASPVRLPGESAVYRANEIPYGYPLRKGLGVKDEGAPAWSVGRDGDLRDIWRTAIRGAMGPKGTLLGRRGKFLTVLGREKVIERKLKDVTQEINAIGQFVQKSGCKTVAVSLSNSVELIAILFASAFYGFKLVLVPYALEQSQLQALLSKTKADVFVAEAATVELVPILSAAPSIKKVIWVVKEGSRHIDWAEKPDGVGELDVLQWHDIVQQQAASSDVPDWDKESKTNSITTFWKGKNGQYEPVEYTPESIIAGVSGLLATLVRTYKITYEDTLLSTASLTESYALCWTLAAIYSNANIALNSVAGDSVDLTMAAVGVSPTIIVSSSGTIAKHHEQIAAFAPGIPQKLSNFLAKRDMQSGYMNNRKAGSITPNLSALRALLISQSASDGLKVSSSILAGLRVALGTRIGYALTARDVAGAVTQTNVLDYRNQGGVINVGPPVSSLELYVTGKDENLDRDLPEGKIVVRGPAVLGGKAELDISARIDADRTIVLL